MEEITPETFIEKNILSIGTFLFGTIILISFLISNWDFLIIVGILYVSAAIIVHVFHFFATIIFHFIEKRNPIDTSIKIFLILSNIPITILYIYIVLNLKL
ncbi:hypothetical protein ACFO3U_12085 [Flavobacterium ponti]|jgi:hypothetical protein|uniref:Uncharacterized protein n=1 Tax=Flavobacterium ponti TaxID=665133 RepID=A0ABV9P544_9FLAO